jgi:WD40 repeat protein
VARLFISHSSANDAEAVAICEWLADAGWDDVFLDLDPERGINAGERWERALHEAASRCEAVLFLISRAWLDSRWCLREFNLARRFNKRLFAAVIEAMPLGELPADLTGQWQVADLAGGQDPVVFRVIPPRTHREAQVLFSREGLARLRGGLAKAGLDPRFFAWPPSGEPNRSPYRGLKPLEAEDAGIFFGRDAPIVEALDKLRGLREAAASHFLVVLGASGSGKSSFLRAGLLPRLARDDRNFLTLPLIRPERAAISGEAGLVAALDAALTAAEVVYPRATIRAAVAGGADGVLPLLRRLVDTAFARTLADEADAPRPAVVLAIDQAEELFQADGLAEGEALLDLVRCLVMADPPAVIALVAIRSDAYDRLETAKALEGLRQETFPLLPLPRGAYQTVIEGPVARLTDTGRRLAIEPRLTQRLLEDIEAGGGSDALPLLAFTLEQLYVEYGRAGGVLRLTDYETFGGIGGALEAAVGRALIAADSDPRIPRDRDTRLLLLRRGLIPWLAVIDPETSSPRRRVARRADVPDESRSLIDLLVEQRLLTTDRNVLTGEVTIEPAHESLLRRWGLLQGWLEEDVAALRTLEVVKRAARDWAANARSAEWLNHAGGRLEDAERVAARPDLAGDLSENARDYLRECRTREQVIQDEKEAAGRRLAERLAEAQLNESRFLTSIAEAELRDGHVERALLIAREALPRDMRKPDRPIWGGAFGPIARARTQDRAFAVAVGHGGPVDSTAFSSDGRWVVTASADWTARLWDAATVALRATLEGHTDRVLSAAFNSDGRQVVTASADRTARLWDAATGALRVTLEGHTDRVLSAAFSSDGRWVVTASADRTARLWDAADGALLTTLKDHADEVNSAAFSPYGRRVVTASADRTARLWDAADGGLLATLEGHTDVVNSAVFSPDGRRVVTASADRTARLWETANGAPLTTLRGHTGRVNSAAFNPDGRRVVTASTDRTARLWETADGTMLATLDGHTGEVDCAAFSPDGRRVVTASADRTARLWDTAEGGLLATLEGHADHVNSAAFSPDGRRVVTASGDRTARLWDAAEGALLAILEGHTNWVLSAAFSPNGRRIVTASADRTARLWDAAKGASRAILQGHTAPVNRAEFSPDGRRVVTASRDGTARLWDAVTGAELATLKGHTGKVNSAAFSHNGRRIVTASADRTARLWEATDGTMLATLDGHTGEVDCAAFSPDGRRVVTGSTDRTARLWDAAEGTLLATLEGRGGLRSTAFSPDGARVVTASDDGTTRLWDATTGELLAALDGHSISVYSAAFSPDGLRVVTASADRTARLWDTTEGTLLATLEGHTNWVLSAAFSPDGRQVVTASVDRTARLWDAAEGALRAIAILQGHAAPVNTAAFSPDGRRVVTASADETARLWSVWPLLRDDTAAWIAVAAFRALTPQERSRAFHMTAVLGNAEANLEPDRHRQLAEGFERDGAARLEQALLHYAIAVRLYEEQGRDEEAAPCRMRRGSLARLLPPQTAVRIAYEAMDWRPSNSADG